MKGLLGRAFVTAALIALIVAGGLVVLGLVVDSVADLEGRNRWVTHSYQVIDSSDRLLADLTQAESLQRGFVLTGKESYTGLYKGSVKDSNIEIGKLEKLVDDRPLDQEPRVRQLDRLLQERFAALDQGIRLRRTSGIDAARRSMSLGYGASLMERIRIKSSEIQGWEQHLLDQRTDTAKATSNHLRQAVVVSISLLAMLVLVVSLIAADAHHSRRRLADMVDSVGDAFFALDEKWRFTHFNSAAERFFNLHAAEVLGRRFLEVFPAAAGSQVEVTYHAAMQSRKQQTLETLDETLGKHVEIRCFPSKEGLSVFCHDVSGRVEQERKIQELNEMLERRVLDRTAQLETFCYSVAHDMRMHIRGISVNAAMLAEELAGASNTLVPEKLERLTIATKQMSRLVEDLLKFARTTTQEVHAERVDLTYLAREVAEGLRLDGSCSPETEFEIAPSLETVADPQLAGVVIQNLIENACKYCRPDLISRIEVGCSGPDLFFVRDNGIGFEQRYADRVFLPFERLHSDGRIPGSGIGLANVKRIAERHGGRIWVESQLGVGSTFYFSFVGAIKLED